MIFYLYRKVCVCKAYVFVSLLKIVAQDLIEYFLEVGLMV